MNLQNSGNRVTHSPHGTLKVVWETFTSSVAGKKWVVFTQFEPILLNFRRILVSWSSFLKTTQLSLLKICTNRTFNEPTILNHSVELRHRTPPVASGLPCAECWSQHSVRHSAKQKICRKIKNLQTKLTVKLVEKLSCQIFCEDIFVSFKFKINPHLVGFGETFCKSKSILRADWALKKL